MSNILRSVAGLRLTCDGFLGHGMAMGGVDVATVLVGRRAMLVKLAACEFACLFTPIDGIRRKHERKRKKEKSR